MKNKQIHFCFISFRHVFFALFPFFFVLGIWRYTVVTLSAQLLWSIWNFADFFVMVCKYACVIGFFVNLFFVTFFEF